MMKFGFENGLCYGGLHKVKYRRWFKVSLKALACESVRTTVQTNIAVRANEHGLSTVSSKRPLITTKNIYRESDFRQRALP